MIKKLFENFVLKFTDWLFRAKTAEAVLLRTAAYILVLVYGAPSLIEVLLRLLLDSIPDTYRQVRQLISIVDGWILSLCSLMILVSIGLMIFKFIDGVKSKRRKRVIVVEGRGLRDDDGSPLEEVISKHIEGNITPILLDLRNYLDGKVIEPQRAISKIMAVHTLVKQSCNGDRKDLSLVYGGLTSVPYTFLTGVLFDDENNIITYDWDRIYEKWRPIDEVDDGKTFQVQGLYDIGKSDDVVIALAYSYSIEVTNLDNTFTYPVVRISLNNMSSDSHWSKHKQNRLAQDFFEIVKQVSAAGVKRIHLVMAAPNSVVFTFGRRYDKRNLPEILVYQFERGRSPSYPWSIKMPVSGVNQAEVVYTERLESDSNGEFSLCKAD